MNRDIYTFGRVVKILGNNRIGVEYDGSFATLENVMGIFKIGTWVRFYGFYNGESVSVAYIEELQCIDINVLVGVAQHINRE